MVDAYHRDMPDNEARQVQLHEDGSVSYVVRGDGDVEWHVTVGPPSGEYEPVLPEQGEWLRRRRART